MREVQNKWNTLKVNDDIWAKLIYFEQNRRLAKAYVSAPILTIDGSTNGLDGFRIGLSGIDNLHRGLDSIACLRSIGQGIKLKIDSQGNILMRKIGKSSLDRCSVWIKEWPSTNKLTPTNLNGKTPTKISTSDLSTSSSFNCNGSTSSSSTSSSSSVATTTPTTGAIIANNASDQNWIMQEIEECDVSYKIFDMQHFRQQLELRRQEDTLAMDWRQCVSIISFSRNNYPGCATNDKQKIRADFASNQTRPLPKTTIDSPQKILNDPCWLMLINIIAIDVLKSSVCDRKSPTSSFVGSSNECLPAPKSSSLKTKPSSLSSIMDNDNTQDQYHCDASLADYLSPFELKASGGKLASNQAMNNSRASRAILRRPVSGQWDLIGDNASNRANLRSSSSIASIYAQSSMRPFGRTPMQSNNGFNSSRASITSRNGLQFNKSRNQQHYQSSQYLVGSGSGGSSSNYSSGHYNNNNNNNNNSSNNVIYGTTNGLNRNTTNNNRSRQREFDSKFSNSDNYSTNGFGHLTNEDKQRGGSTSASSSNYYHGRLYNDPTGPHKPQQQRGSSSRWNLEQNFSGKIPYIRNFDESKMKSQSLSNFDWSHKNDFPMNSNINNKRLLIDPRSVRSTSIKMNFDDDDEDEEDENDIDERAPIEGDDSGLNDERNIDHEGGDKDFKLLERRNCLKQTTRSSDLSTGVNNPSSNVNSRRAIIDLNKRTTAKWNHQMEFKRLVRGGKQPQQQQQFEDIPLDENDDEIFADHGDNEPGCKDILNGDNFKKSKNANELSDEIIDRDHKEEEEKDRDNKNDGEPDKGLGSNIRQQQPLQKLSRASVASTLSSSGCLENDYFISNSSPSMSSSGVSHEGELFGHQPPSSSGIVCSGNTSDDYEIYGRTTRTTRNINKILGGSAADDLNSSLQNVSADNRNTKKRDTSNMTKKLTLCNDEGEISRHVRNKNRHLSRSISRNRHHNVKRVDLPDDELICDHCEPCDCIQADLQVASCDCCCDCDLFYYFNQLEPAQLNEVSSAQR